MYRRLHRCIIRSALDNQYTPEIVEAIFENWPAIESARLSGTMSINVSQRDHVSFAKIEASRDFSHMIPRASRRTNTAYKIDDLASIVCDILTAMEHQTPLSVSRLMRYHYEGYTYQEIADQDGCTEGAIRFSLRASYGRIADWLEAPKEPKPEPHYEFDTHTHTRSFAEPPHHIPAQR